MVAFLRINLVFEGPHGPSTVGPLTVLRSQRQSSLPGEQGAFLPDKSEPGGHSPHYLLLINLALARADFLRFLSLGFSK